MTAETKQAIFFLRLVLDACLENLYCECITWPCLDSGLSPCRRPKRQLA